MANRAATSLIPRLPIVIMGVCGSGKSTVGAALAERLQLAFVEGDALHSPASRQKMQHGVSLDDVDRAPWLAAVAACLAAADRYPRGLVIACSALKQGYRQQLRASTPRVRFVFLDVPLGLARQRVAERAHHFMPASLVPAQFETLERPAPTERDVLTIDASATVAASVGAVLRGLET